MSIKLKVLGLGLLAVMATSAFVVVNASANGTGGHFVSDSFDGHTFIEGEESGTHLLHFKRHGASLTERIGCEIDEYNGTVTGNTAESITITPHYTKCQTTNTDKTAVTVDTNGCTYTFTVTEKTVSTTEQEVHLFCPAGKAIQITHPSCTISIHPQTIKNAVTYTNLIDTTDKHYVTMHVNATFTTTNHGLCQFIIPTHDFGILEGSVTVRGFDTNNDQVNVTAT